MQAKSGISWNNYESSIHGIKLTNLAAFSIDLSFLLLSQTSDGGYYGYKNLGINTLLPSIFSKKHFMYLGFLIN